MHILEYLGERPSTLDIFGYIPFISVIIGLFRVVYGFLLLIFSLGRKFKLAIYHIVRGCVEIIPFLGGIIATLFDMMRIDYFEKKHLKGRITHACSTYKKTL